MAQIVPTRTLLDPGEEITPLKAPLMAPIFPIMTTIDVYVPTKTHIAA